MVIGWPLASIPQALAIDPATVEGVYHYDGQATPLTHAYAHLHDNAEGILNRTPELRILLADREMDQATLRGLVFLPVEELARQGEVQGLLIVLDPANPNEINVTYLAAPGEPGMSMMNQTFTTSGQDLWTSFAFDPQRVAGALTEGDPADGGRAFEFTFSAPVFNEPAVTANLKGKEATASPQAEALQARVEAMKAGDLEAMAAGSSTRSNAGMDEYLEEMGTTREQLAAMLKEYAPMQEEMLGRIDRVIARGDRAVLIFSNDGTGTEWASFVLEDGVWKVDD